MAGFERNWWTGRFGGLFIGIFSTLFSPLADSRSYVVVAGDTLSDIVWTNVQGRLYGEGGNLLAIVQLNPHIPDPHFIRPGDVIELGAITVAQDRCVNSFVSFAREDRGRLPTSTGLSTTQEQGRPFVGADFLNKRWGLYVQSGGSLVTQEVSAPSASSGFSENRQLIVRNEVGFWLNRFFIEGSWRETVQNSKNDHYEPRWIRGVLGYSFELPRFWSMRPNVSLVAGYSQYSNKGPSDAGYFDSYRTTSYGFRSRFLFNQKWEMGGDLLYSPVQNGGSTFVQGDFRHWFHSDWALGLGYWIENTRMKDVGSRSFDEKNYALESYLRWSY